MAILVGQKGTTGARGMIANDLANALDAAEKAQAITLPDGVFDVAAYRAWFDDYSNVIAPKSVRPKCEVKDTALETGAGAVPVRIYTPPNSEAVIVFTHGGAWMMGSVETHDHICRWLATATNSRVISVEYGLAPEHPFPFAVVQVAAAVQAVIGQGTLNLGKRVFVAGDSAGATIAAMALLRLDRSVRELVAGFVSIYGAYSPVMQLSSHSLFGDGRFGLTRQTMMWCWNLYAPHLDPSERQQITPLGSNIDYFPPTLCIGAECDLLIDDSLAFYSHLAKVGANVDLSLWPGVTHGAMHFVGLVDSVTAAAHVIVEFVTSHRSRGVGEATGSSMGRLLARAENQDRVQLPFLPADANLADRHSIAIETPHLMRRSRQHGSLAHKLGSEIIKGTYAPGDILISEEDGVSPGRSSYREAVRTLAAKGLVTATPKVGTRVAPRSSWRLLDPDVLAWHFESRLDEKFVRDAFELRKVAEPSAAALTALRMTPAIKAFLAGALAALSNEAGGEERNRGRVRFHEIVLSGGENELLTALWPAIQVVLQWSANVGAEAEVPGEAVRSYANAFAKLTSGDAEGAMIAMAQLVDLSLAESLGHLRRIQASAAAEVASENA